MPGPVRRTSSAGWRMASFCVLARAVAGANEETGQLREDRQRARCRTCVVAPTATRACASGCWEGLRGSSCCGRSVVRWCPTNRTWVADRRRRRWPAHDARRPRRNSRRRRTDRRPLEVARQTTRWREGQWPSDPRPWRIARPPRQFHGRVAGGRADAGILVDRGWPWVEKNGFAPLYAACSASTNPMRVPTTHPARWQG